MKSASLKLTKVLSLAAASLLALGETAQALTIYSLDQANIVTPDGGPFGNVSVTLVDSTHASIAFTALTSGGSQYYFGGNGAIALNLNGAATPSGFAVTARPGGSGAVGDLQLPPVAQNEDGFGSFNFTIDNFDGFSHALSSVSFTLTKASGSWASESDILTANASGHFAAAHIFATLDNVEAFNTGYATDSGGPSTTSASVPDTGSTLALAGLALAALGTLKRKMRS